jgi:molecular chaperone HtpG
MAAVTDRQEYSFQAEIKQLLHLLSHSLYQSREIALRELVSNASDALDKMRYIGLTDDAYRDTGPLEIVIEAREPEGELVIRDNGIGMTHDELVTNLGTIAHSGSVEYLKTLAAQGKEKSDLSLIGQFGVGFYSVFMIAERVRVRSRGYAEESGWEWESDGSGTFSVSPVEGSLPRGTELTIHLKADAKEFGAEWRIKQIIKRYSNFVPYPIRLGSEGEIVNDRKPIWVEPKSQVSEEQYTQFYQHLSHHTGEKPLWHLHLAADSPIQFRAIVYCPPTNFENLGFARLEHGLNLCARRVLVQGECRDLLPEYLRFLRGLVDSEDLPLNVSRETLQDNSVIRKIRSALVKGVLDRLDSLAGDDPATYRTFYDQFERVIKEGLIVDSPNKERIAKLLRFPSSRSDDLSAVVSLDDYIEKMPANQKYIYYFTGADRASVAKSPNLEIFRRRGLEVLYLTGPIDEFAVGALGKYKEKPLLSIDSADLEIPEAGTAGEGGKPDELEPVAEAGFARVLELFRAALGSRVHEVRESKRLTDSPCCLVNVEGGPSSQMQRLLKMANKEFVASARILEVNPSAPLVRRLCRLSANTDHDAFVKECALQLWTNAMILDGAVPEPEDAVARMQAFMTDAAEKRSPLIL